MKKITSITKAKILDLFKNGVDDGSIVGPVIYPYYGRLKEIEYLKRLYNLETMESYDSRFKNAELDIYQHTENNKDYDFCWVFKDDRFPLKNGTDEEYLTFLCEVFHPEVRIEGPFSNEIFSEIQKLIRRDGYELYVCEEVSEQPIYSYRELSDKEMKSKRFVPFSERKGKESKALKISRKIRSNISKLIEQHSNNDDTDFFVTDTGYSYIDELKNVTFEEIKSYYPPKAYNDADEYVEASDIQHLILRGSPKHVLDVIEIYFMISKSKSFASDINNELSEIDLKLIDGKIEQIKPPVKVQLPKKDDSLKDLICKADLFYKNQDHDSLQSAVEKIWDAFERVKTKYMDPDKKDKKESAQKVIETIVGNNEYWKTLLDEEFRKLTEIGNKNQIRHFETDKKAIDNDDMLNYLYIRCLALVDLAVKSIEKS